MVTTAVPDDETSTGATEPTLVLVVEDDRAVRDMIGMALRLDGFEVIESGTGAGALRLVQSRDVALVLLDNRLPDMTGHEVVGHLRAEPITAGIPVILVTGDFAAADRVAGLDAGATDYIVKPFDPDELLARVRAQLRQQAVWRSVVEDTVLQRRAIGEAMRRAERAPTVEGAAATICEELVRLADVRGAAFYRFGAQDAVCVADGGSPPWALRAGASAPETLGRHLRRRAALGPWIEEGVPDAATRPLSLTETVICAPLQHDGVTVGALVLSIDRVTPSMPRRRIPSLMSAAIDFANAAGALLGAALHRLRVTDASGASLRDLLARGAFVPRFQPIIDLEGGRTVGWEALTRFLDGSDPERRFREAADEGLGIPLETATIKEAIDHAQRLPGDGWLSLNASPTLVLEGTVIDEQLRSTDRPLVIELSEHDPVGDYQSLRRAVGRFAGRADLSVDDAGSGFASLRHVLILEPAFVKLDRSWVAGVDADPARQALIAGLRHFADATGSMLIAEGIETAAELSSLQSLGILLGQGFYLGRPEPA